MFVGLGLLAILRDAPFLIPLLRKAICTPSPPATARAASSCARCTEAYASFGVRCVAGSDVPNNAGSLAPVTVRAPAGCILNAEFPAAVSARHAIGQMLPDVVLGCLD